MRSDHDAIPTCGGQFPVIAPDGRVLRRVPQLKAANDGGWPEQSDSYHLTVDVVKLTPLFAWRVVQSFLARVLHRRTHSHNTSAVHEAAYMQSLVGSSRSGRWYLCPVCGQGESGTTEMCGKRMSRRQ